MKGLSTNTGSWSFQDLYLKRTSNKVHWHWFGAQCAVHIIQTDMKLTSRLVLVVIVENNSNHEIDDETPRHQ